MGGSLLVRNVRRQVQVDGMLSSPTSVTGMRGITRGCCIDAELLPTACLRRTVVVVFVDVTRRAVTAGTRCDFETSVYT